MIKHQFLKDEGVLIIEPAASLRSADFDVLSAIVDPYIREHGKLDGLIIYAKSFPGWHDFASLLAHIKFVKEHHAFINKVAAVADEGIIAILPAIADRFVKAEVRHFGYDNLDNAIDWITRD